MLEINCCKMLSGLVLHFNFNPTEGAVYVSIGLKSKVQLYFIAFSPFLIILMSHLQRFDLSGLLPFMFVMFGCIAS